MVKTKQKQAKKSALKKAPSSLRERVFETDSTYFLKLVVFVLLGTFWVKFDPAFSWLGVYVAAIPVGMLIGFILVRQFEKHQADRKIWYAILLIVTIICYNMPSGIVV